MTEKKELKSKQAIAKFLGVSPRTIERWKEEGIIQSEGNPPKYDLALTVQSCIKHLSDKARGREKKKSDSENESAKLEAEVRLKTAKAEIAELELKELKGELHRAKDVEDITTDHVLMIRSLLMGLPNKLAVDLAAASSAAEASERIKKEIYSILDELSRYEYNAEDYKRRVRERVKWQNGDNTESEQEKTPG